MRFNFDSEDLEGGQEPLFPSSLPGKLDQHQQIEFLRLIHEGMGRTMACAQLGIEIKSLRRDLARCSAFRSAVEHVEQVRADNLYTGLYVAALRGDTRSARFLLAREDRANGRSGSRRNPK